MLLHNPAKGNSATQWRLLHWRHLGQQCFGGDVLLMGPGHGAMEDADAPEIALILEFTEHAALQIRLHVEDAAPASSISTYRRYFCSGLTVFTSQCIAHLTTGRFTVGRQSPVGPQFVAVALDPQPGQESRGAQGGDPAWRQQPELLAHDANPCDPAGHVQRMAQGAGFAQRQGLVVQDPGVFGLT